MIPIENWPKELWYLLLTGWDYKWIWPQMAAGSIIWEIVVLLGWQGGRLDKLGAWLYGFGYYDC